MDWQATKSEILFNPRLPPNEQAKLSSILLHAPVEPGHLWLSTSGSSGYVKWVALSKSAILASAQAVNAFLHSGANDVWLNALPPFHVGGLGIWARSYLSQAQVIDLYSLSQGHWNHHLFHTLAHQHQMTLSALVPAQVYDLVQQNLSPPPSLRALIVGGGALSETLYHKGVALGWPLLPSYGLTECASQVATWREGNLELLPHIQARVTPEGCIEIKSPSLLTLYALQTPQGMHYHDPKKEGWFTAEDQGSLRDRSLTLHGRQGHFIKIGGESVDLSRLERILEEVQIELNTQIDVALVAYSDTRLGHVIHLASAASSEETNAIIDAFHRRVLPFEKIRHIHSVEKIPRTPLHKVIKSELIKMIEVSKQNPQD